MAFNRNNSNVQFEKLFDVGVTIDEKFFLKPNAIAKDNSLTYSFIQKYYSFKEKIYQFFEKKEDNPLLRAQKALEKEVDELVKLESFNIVGDMIKQGYCLTQKQRKIIENKYSELIKDNSLKEIATFITWGIPLMPKNIHALFFNLAFQTHCTPYLEYHEAKSHLSAMELSIHYFKRTDYSQKVWDNNNGINTILTPIYEYMDNEENKKSLYHNWRILIVQATKKNWYKQDTLLLNPYLIFKYSVIAHLPIKEYSALTRDIKLMSNSSFATTIIKELENNMGGNYQPAVHNLLKKTQEAYGNPSDSLPPKSSITASYKDKLPPNIETILHRIDDLYHQMKKEERAYSIEEVEILVAKRIPEIINKYLGIKSNLREKLKNRENKNAKDLLLESITNIEQRLEEIYQDGQEEKLRSLTVSQKYTKKLLTK